MVVSCYVGTRNKNLGPLQELQTLLIAEPTLQLLRCMYFKSVGYTHSLNTDKGKVPQSVQTKHI